MTSPIDLRTQVPS